MLKLFRRSDSPDILMQMPAKHQDSGQDAEPLTVLLNRMRQGDRNAGRRAVDLVYTELHKIAAGQMRRERPGHPLQTTALVNEAYLKLAGGGAMEIQDRGHFFAVASQQMRRILVDYARAGQAQRRGGGAQQVDLDLVRLGSEPRSIDVLALDEALKELERLEPRAGRIVELRYFGGYTDKEVVEALGIPLATVRRDWEFARTWLFDRMRGGERRGRKAE
jgi:RNA polymerase sigma-70 factor, ECF subfamily